MERSEKPRGMNSVDGPTRVGCLCIYGSKSKLISDKVAGTCNESIGRLL